MNITLKSRKYISARECFLTYKTDIPVNVGYEKAQDTILLFTDYFMKDIVDYSGNLPCLIDIIYNEETNFVEFTVAKKYVNSEYVMGAFTGCKDDRCFLMGILIKENNEGSSGTSDKLIDITREEYNRLNFWKE